MRRTGKSIETESRLVLASGWGRGEWGMTAYGSGLSFGGLENVLELDSDV